MGICETFKAFSDPIRRDILTMLNEKTMTAGEIAESIGITPAALSYHLRILKSADLVTEYKNKNFISYEINTSVVEELTVWLMQFGGKNHENENNVDNSIHSGGGSGIYAENTSR